MLGSSAGDALGSIDVLPDGTVAWPCSSVLGVDETTSSPTVGTGVILAYPKPSTEGADDGLSSVVVGVVGATSTFAQPLVVGPSLLPTVGSVTGDGTVLDDGGGKSTGDAVGSSVADGIDEWQNRESIILP
jgi:hypothetical protein